MQHMRSLLVSFRVKLAKRREWYDHRGGGGRAGLSGEDMCWEMQSLQAAEVGSTQSREMLKIRAAHLGVVTSVGVGNFS